MNKLQRWLVWAYIKKQIKGGNKMWVITLQVLAFVVKNVALILGIIEAVFKAVSGIISLTPTKRDDKLLPYVDNFFSGIKRALYQLTEIMTK